jgi:Ras GTPase-activating-like protein IQGAP2/3
MAADERREVAQTLEGSGDLDSGASGGVVMDERRTQVYANLFFLLQGEPRHIASLCRMVSLAEIDTLLQTVMFTLYGNQYESREEHLLLTMFQVRLFLFSHRSSSSLNADPDVSRSPYSLLNSK